MRNQLELFFDSAFSLQKVFNNGLPEEKHKIVYALCEQIELNNKILRWNFREPWKQMLKIKSEPPDSTDYPKINLLKKVR